jgi:hypothetical protein
LFNESVTGEHYVPGALPAASPTTLNCRFFTSLASYDMVINICLSLFTFMACYDVASNICLGLTQRDGAAGKHERDGGAVGLLRRVAPG